MSEPQPASTALSAAALFGVLWNELVALLGTPATAALMRRAIKHASARSAGATLPVISRDGLEYTCAAPAAWQDRSNGQGVEQLRGLVRDDLFPLVRDLTGPVITRRLGHVPELVDAGLADRETP